MRTWIVRFELADDGIEDPSLEIKGKYFSARELKKVVAQVNMAGLEVRNLTITRVRRSQT